jgi:predicted membrane-bound spermidine synthase
MKTEKRYTYKRPLPLFALVFALGMQTMILELTLPRLLAPAFGNTLFCWTAAIGEVLAALAVGYQIGGLISTGDKDTNAKRLWRLSLASAACVAFTGFMGDRVINTLSDLGMVCGPLVATFLLAVPAVGAGAAVLPLSVALASGQASEGKNSGTIYALSTVGSVLGVLVTGYFLLPTLGVMGTLFCGAALVIFMLLFTGRLLLPITILSILCVLYYGSFRHLSRYVLVDKSNGYHRIKVVQHKGDGPPIRLLYLDSTLEGAVKTDSRNPGIPYQREGARIAASMPDLRRCFFMGGGAFCMPGYIKHRRPDVIVDVAEIDPDLVKISKEYFALEDDVNVHIGDAREVLDHTTKQYGLIMNDAFHGIRNIPFHLVTRDFNRIVKQRLTDKGIYCVNVMGFYPNSRFVCSIIKTLEQDFKHLNYIDVGKKKVKNMWVLASKRPINIGKYLIKTHEYGMILTDNHAPIEYLIADDLLNEEGRSFTPSF